MDPVRKFKRYEVVNASYPAPNNTRIYLEGATIVDFRLIRSTDIVTDPKGRERRMGKDEWCYKMKINGVLSHWIHQRFISDQENAIPDEVRRYFTHPQ